MKKIFFKIILFFLSTLILTNCNQSPDYDYLMRHPNTLQKAYSQCRGQNSTYCETVVRAAEDFRVLVQQRADNPQLFAQQIMQAQREGQTQKIQLLYAVVAATTNE